MDKEKNTSFVDLFLFPARTSSTTTSSSDPPSSPLHRRPSVKDNNRDQSEKFINCPTTVHQISPVFSGENNTFLIQLSLSVRNVLIRPKKKLSLYLQQ
ncbi:hypothetical protein INR49_010239 [Caranx melampygus]|nr:hypothetical protein INR49_010239 [Caranx melampygus]